MISQCLNPNCANKNSVDDKFCNKCGEKLLLSHRYLAIEYINKGAFGRTFKAIDKECLNRLCVIKQLLPDYQGKKELEQAEKLFEQEAQRLLELGKHQQIPSLLAFFKDNNRLYLVQEFIDGEDLYQKIIKKGKLTELEVYYFLKNLLPILNFIHEKKTIHRDIKPQNIIHLQNGNFILIDFGIAKQIQTIVTSRTIAGTYGYASPEQMLMGKAFPSSDLYSLAVSAIHLLTGCCPTEKKIYDIRKNRFRWREYCQEENIIINNNFSQILERMLKYSIDERFSSAKEVLEALNHLSEFQEKIKINQISHILNKSLNTKVTQASINCLTLVSSNKLKYSNLEQLLAKKEWKCANEETNKQMLKLIGKTNWWNVENDDWKKIFPVDLQEIDQLWLKYSQGLFGFSVQKEIYTRCGGSIKEIDNWTIYSNFAKKVGWKKVDGWLNYSDLNFNINAPFGHLPWLLGSGLNRVRGSKRVNLFCCLISHI